MAPGRTAVTALLAGALLAAGGWSVSGGLGYERGKADAANALTPHGAVVVDPDGTCHVFTEPGQEITFTQPARAQTVVLIRPAR